MTLDKEEIDKHSSDDMPQDEPQRKVADHKKHAKSPKRGSAKKGGGSRNASAKSQSKKKVTCRQCDKKFADKVAFKRHYDAVHSKRSSSASKASKSSKKGKKRDSRTPDVICRQCEKRFSGTKQLESHIISKHPRVECKECHKTFINDQALKIHHRNKHEEKEDERRASQLSATANDFVPGSWGQPWSARSSFTQSPGQRSRRRSRPGDQVRRASRSGVPFTGGAPTRPGKDKKKKEPKYTEETAPSFPGSPFPGSPRKSLRKERAARSASRRISLPQPDPADLAGEAPPINYEIGAGWVVYWNPPTVLEHSVNNADYVNSLREIADFQGVANFWNKISSIQKPSKIVHGAHNLMVFRRGLVPCWESFPAGGSWIINYHRWEEDVAQIDALWETVMFGLASEAFGTPEVVGASIHIRTRGYRVCIWNRDNRVGDVRFQIADKLRMLLSIHPRKEIKYKYFSCCMRDGSTTTQATPYQFVKVTF